MRKERWPTPTLLTVAVCLISYGRSQRRCHRHGSNVMIACVENSRACEQETLRTLKFATSCANIHTPAARLSNQEKLILDLKVNIKVSFANAFKYMSLILLCKK